MLTSRNIYVIYFNFLLTSNKECVLYLKQLVCRCLIRLFFALHHQIWRRSQFFAFSSSLLQLNLSCAFLQRNAIICNERSSNFVRQFNVCCRLCAYMRRERKAVGMFQTILAPFHNTACCNYAERFCFYLLMLFRYDLTDYDSIANNKTVVGHVAQSKLSAYVPDLLIVSIYRKI